jgi:hypothetical protein
MSSEIQSPAQQTAETLQRCRTIRPSGHQCQNAALSGHDQCFIHGRDRRRLRNVRYSPAVIEIPLLDNCAAIQIVCTDVARALAAGTIDHATARFIVSTVRVAAQCLPRPAAPKASSKAGKESAEPPEPVAAIVTTAEGEELAPPTPYAVRGEKEEKKEAPWSLSRFLYHQMRPEKANAPLPPEGYIDPHDANVIPSGDETNLAPRPEPGRQKAAEHNKPKPAPQPGILPELTAEYCPVEASGQLWLGFIIPNPCFQDRNGFPTFSAPMLVSYPCPGITRVSSGSTSSRS